MSFGDHSQTQLAYVIEVTHGTNPGGSNWSAMRYVTHSLAPTITPLVSQEQRNDRQRTGVTQGQKRVDAEIACELSYLAYKDWIRAALRYDTTVGSPTSTAGTDTQFIQSTKKITRTSGSFVTDGFLVGMKVRATGSTSNDDVYTLEVVTALEMTTEETQVDEAATADVKIQGNLAALGTTKTSYSVEAGFADISQYEVFTGIVPTGFSITATPDELIGLSFPVIGGAQSLSASPADAALTTVDASPPVDTYSAGAGKILEGGSAVALIAGFTLDVSENAAGQDVLGNQAPVGVSDGNADVTGTVRAYFQDAVLANKYSNGTESSLEIAFQDAAGNELHIELFTVKYTANGRAVGGDGPVMLELSFQAYRDTTTGETIRINMIPAIAL